MYPRHGTAVVLPEPLEVISEAAHAAANAIQAFYRIRAIATPVGESNQDSRDDRSALTGRHPSEGCRAFRRS